MDALSQQPPAAGAAYTNNRVHDAAVSAEHALDSPATQTLRWRRRGDHHLRELPGDAAALSVDTSRPRLDSTTGTRLAPSSGSRLDSSTDTTLDASARHSARRKRPSHAAAPVRSQAASPEVISSLIDQLAAISASTQSHFDGRRESSPPPSHPAHPSHSARA